MNEHSFRAVNPQNYLTGSQRRPRQKTVLPGGLKANISYHLTESLHHPILQGAHLYVHFFARLPYLPLFLAYILLHAIYSVLLLLYFLCSEPSKVTAQLRMTQHKGLNHITRHKMSPLVQEHAYDHVSGRLNRRCVQVTIEYLQKGLDELFECFTIDWGMTPQQISSLVEAIPCYFR